MNEKSNFVSGFERMLKLNDVCKFLNIHASTLTRWTNKGLIKGYRISGRGDFRYRKQDIEDFLRERVITGH